MKKTLLFAALFFLAAPGVQAKTMTMHTTWYGPGFAGNRTACGETFNPGALTAAHKTLPCGTRLRVQNPRTGRSIVVRVNDRGPYRAGYQLDLSQGAARSIGMGGTAALRVTILSRGG